MTSRLEEFVRERYRKHGMLLCSHAVMGFPNLAANKVAVKSFIAAGADLMELQLPFSDPSADGPVLLAANQAALANGVTISACLAAARDIVAENPGTGFLIMTYYNVIFARGIAAFAQEAAACGILGVIVPDLPHDEAGEWLAACRQFGLSPIWLVSPATASQRLREIAAVGDGFIYCVARKGITGQQSQFDQEFWDYVARVAAATALPLAVGFGIRTREDMVALAASPQVHIAMVCSRAIQVLAEDGLEAACQLLRDLKAGVPT